MDGKVFAECIKINDSIKEIIETPSMNNLMPIFILCQYSIVNYPYINIRNFINKTISEEEKLIIRGSTFRFSFTTKEIISMHKNKMEIFIVNKAFLIKCGIDHSIIKLTNIFYYTDSKKKCYILEMNFGLF